MKKIKRILLSILPVIAILVLILDAKTSLEGARLGIDICIKTIIPSLFPFFFLSGFITNRIGTGEIFKIRFLRKLCKIPAGTEPLLLLGFIGGYPIGAEAINTAYCNRSIPKRAAERMLGFCNNAGPAFIFGIAGSLFDSWCIPWIIWMIIILSSILTAMLLPAKITETSVLRIDKKTNPFENALKGTAKVCGWVILFRILITVLNRWVFWLLPDAVSVLLIGFLELANGCIELNQIENPAFKMIYVTVMLSFGGLCVGLQTISVAKNLDCKSYFFSKVLQMLITIPLSFISFLIYRQNFTVSAMTILILSILTVICIGLVMRKNNSGKYQPAGV